MLSNVNNRYSCTSQCSHQIHKNKGSSFNFSIKLFSILIICTLLKIVTTAKLNWFIVTCVYVQPSAVTEHQARSTPVHFNHRQRRCTISRLTSQLLPTYNNSVCFLLHTVVTAGCSDRVRSKTPIWETHRVTLFFKKEQS